MRVRLPLTLFAVAGAIMTAGCERRDGDPGNRNGKADEPRPITPAAKGVDAPPEVSTAPAG